MTQPQTVTVRIMDKDYHIACPAHASENLERADRKSTRLNSSH